MHPLLFYSDICPHSKRILTTLKNTADADKVLRLVCVDTQLDRIPSEIHQVPALLVPTSKGNQVVFDSELYEWLNSILRIDRRAQSSPPTASSVSPESTFSPSMAPGQAPSPPADFMPDCDAFLCDLGGGADSASHLFAGAGEEIRLDYATEGQDTGGRRRGCDANSDGPNSRDDDIINRMMAARNQEISSLYSQIPRPV